MHELADDAAGLTDVLDFLHVGLGDFLPTEHRPPRPRRFVNVADRLGL
jgi:hypothetical protein